MIVFTQTSCSMGEYQTLTLSVWCGTFKCSYYMLATQTVNSADRTLANDPPPLSVNYRQEEHTPLRVSPGMFAFQFQPQITSLCGRSLIWRECVITPLWAECKEMQWHSHREMFAELRVGAPFVCPCEAQMSDPRGGHGLRAVEPGFKVSFSLSSYT